MDYYSFYSYATYHCNHHFTNHYVYCSTDHSTTSHNELQTILFLRSRHRPTSQPRRPRQRHFTGKGPHPIPPIKRGTTTTPPRDRRSPPHTIIKHSGRTRPFTSTLPTKHRPMRINHRTYQASHHSTSTTITRLLNRDRQRQPRMDLQHTMRHRSQGQRPRQMKKRIRGIPPRPTTGRINNMRAT